MPYFISRFIIFLLIVVFLPAPAFSDQLPFSAWLTDLRREAVQKGISPGIVGAVLPNNIRPIPRIVELDRKQPEGKITFAEYRKRIVHPLRIRKGREMMRRYRSELGTVSRTYGVEPQYIVALWGIETNYGQNTGGFDVVQALMTLAYDERRSAFFRKELFNALQILEEGHIRPDQMTGSWAGAMGQCQFMPSSFLKFAQDFNGDGKRDIWNTEIDVFASAANYLSKSGWKGDQRWGREVQVPRNISENLTGLDVKKPLSEWRRLGLRRADGGVLPVVAGMQGSLVMPDGAGGPAYMVYDNYQVIMDWNRSTYFATSVGLLANAIAAY